MANNPDMNSLLWQVKSGTELALQELADAGAQVTQALAKGAAAKKQPLPPAAGKGKKKEKKKKKGGAKKTGAQKGKQHSSTSAPVTEERPTDASPHRDPASRTAARQESSRNSGGQRLADPRETAACSPEELQRAVLWSEILGEPASRRVRRKRMERYGNQGNAGRGRGGDAPAPPKDHREA